MTLVSCSWSSGGGERMTATCWLTGVPIIVSDGGGPVGHTLEENGMIDIMSRDGRTSDDSSKS